MGQYTTKGLYNKYDKNHKERDKTDYYATPTNEVFNILNNLGINFHRQIILEPCAGGGHMAQGIIAYLKAEEQKAQLILTDLHPHDSELPIEIGEQYDFLSDDYPYGENIDWIIMNPPYSTIEPFTIRALEIAGSGVIMLARLQFLEGGGRYENIFENNPPTDVYVYINRIQCWKGGVEPEGSSAQAYAWFIWDKARKGRAPQIHWLSRAT